MKRDRAIALFAVLAILFLVAVVPAQDVKPYQRWSELFRRHDNKTLLEETTAALQKDPRDAMALRFRTVASSFLNQSDLSNKDLALLGTVLPTGTTSEDYEIRCYFNRRSRKYDEAAPECARSLQLNAGNVLAHYGKARIHQGKAETDEAIAALTKTIELDPKFAYALFERGRTYLFGKNDTDQALPDLDRAIALLSDEAEFYILRGIAQKNKNFKDKAVADFTKSIQLNPNLPAAYINLGDVYCLSGEFDKGLAQYDKSISIDPKIAPAHRKRGACNYGKQQYAIAISDFERALAIDPKDVESYFGRGDAVRSLNRNSMTSSIYCNVYVDYSKAIELAPTGGFIYEKRARLLEDFAYVSKFVKDFPCLPNMQARDLAKAGLADAEKAVALSPRDNYSHYQKGRLHLFLEEYDLAVRALDTAITLDPQHAASYCVRGRVFEFMGNTAKRDQDLQKSDSLKMGDCPVFRTYKN